MSNFSIQSKALFALFFTMLVWGTTGVLVRSFTLAVGAIDALLIRMFLAAVVFALLLAFGPGFNVERRDWPRLALLAIFGMLGYYIGSIVGYGYAPAGIGSLLMATQPIMIAMLAGLSASERLTTTTLVGLVVSLVGCLALFWGDATAGTATTHDLLLGAAWIVGASLAWSVYVVFARGLIQKYGALKITGLSVITMCVPLLALVHKGLPSIVLNLNGEALFALATLTLLGATLSVVMWNYAAGHLDPTVVGSALYLVPVLGVLAGWAYLNEPITPQVIIAGLVILTGVAISQFGPVLLRLRMKDNP
jgi:drug/metabolite transporter (DMT)-like permease